MIDSHSNPMSPPAAVAAGRRSGRNGLAATWIELLLAALLVVPHPDVGGEVADLQRVLGVETGVVDLDVGLGVTPQDVEALAVADFTLEGSADGL